SRPGHRFDTVRVPAGPGSGKVRMHGHRHLRGSRRDPRAIAADIDHLLRSDRRDHRPARRRPVPSRPLDDGSDAMTTSAVSDPAVEAPTDSRFGTILRALVPYVAAIVAAFVVAGIIIAVLGHNPFIAFRSVLTTSFKSTFGIVETFT